MNPYTGELVRDLSSVSECFREQFVPVPEELRAGAEEVLGDKQSVVVTGGKSSAIRLLAFAEEKKKCDRVKQKAARKARRKNRR